MIKVILATLLSAFVLISCSGGEKSPEPPPLPGPPIIDTGIAIPDNTTVDSFKILFYGNSHIAHLSEPLALMFKYGKPDKEIFIELSSSAQYLAERLNDSKDVSTLTGTEWTHVIFQAQKYSQSGQVEYPTTAAQNWVKRAKEQSATPIMFPEHPQFGNKEEARMIHNIHMSIAEKEVTCVAPVGLAWDLALSLNEALSLHSPDQNHASALGKVLTAMVFYEVITGESADLLPYIEELNADSETQAFFGQIASQTIQSNIACEF